MSEVTPLLRGKIKKMLKRNNRIISTYRAIRYFLNNELLNLIKYGRIALRYYIVQEETKVIYLSNSKVACSSIKKTFIKKDVLDNYSIHTEVSGISKLKLSRNEMSYYKFSFVRNPFERLVSCYQSKYIKDKKVLKKESLYFEKYLLGYMRIDNGFGAFIGKVVKIPDFLADRHFRSQYNFLYDGKGTCRVDFIGKFENLNEEFGPIKKKYGLGDLPHLNKSGKKNWMDYYTLETTEMVNRKYSKEIHAFGYEQEYQRLISYLKDKQK